MAGPLANVRILDLTHVLNGPFAMLRAAWPALTAQPGGRIVVTGSTTSYNPFVNIDVSYIATAKVTGDLSLSRAVSSSDDVVASVVIPTMLVLLLHHEVDRGLLRVRAFVAEAPGRVESEQAREPPRIVSALHVRDARAKCRSRVRVATARDMIARP